MSDKIIKNHVPLPSFNDNYRRRIVFAKDSFAAHTNQSFLTTEKFIYYNLTKCVLFLIT